MKLDSAQARVSFNLGETISLVTIAHCLIADLLTGLLPTWIFSGWEYRPASSIKRRSAWEDPKHYLVRQPTQLLMCSSFTLDVVAGPLLSLMHTILSMLV